MCEQRLIIRLFLSTEWGSTKTGEQDQLIVTALNCVLQVPRYIPQEQRFDVRVLVRFSSRTENIFATAQLLTRCLVSLCMYANISFVYSVVYTRVWVY